MMICLTAPDEHEFYLNSDIIESLSEEAGRTHVRLITGSEISVVDHAEDIAELINSLKQTRRNKNARGL